MYQWKSSPEAVAGVICEVARSKADRYEFALDGPFADAAFEATTLGLLSSQGNGVVSLTDSGRGLVITKDPVGSVENWVAIRAICEGREFSIVADLGL